MQRFYITVYTNKELEDQKKTLEWEGCKLHHTSKTTGYIPKKFVAIMEEYSGKFGKGYTLKRPLVCDNGKISTQFVWCEYWIETWMVDAPYPDEQEYNCYPDVLGY